MKRLPESPRRWLDVAGWSFFITLCLAPLPGFIHALRTDTLAKNRGLFEVLFGLLGTGLLLWLIRRIVYWIKAGRSVVEVSPDVSVGAPMDYRLLLGREGTATLFCRELQFRRETIVKVNIPLSPAVFDPGLQRWKIEGSVTIPEAPASTNGKAIPQIEWQIDVRMPFKRGYVLEEEHPLSVSVPTEAFWKGRSSG